MRDPKKGLSRRSFIKLAAAGTGTVAVAGGLGVKDAFAVGVPKKWDKEADLVIVGAGGGGLAAAVEASSAGASVIVLEKMPFAGGSSAICGGALCFAGTDVQEEKDIKDSNELLSKDFMSVGGNVNIPELVQAYAENQLDTYQWLKQLGVEFKGLGIASGMSVPRAHYVTPGDLIKILKDKAEANGCEIITRVAAERLIVDEKTGRIRGVLADSRGKKLSFGAGKAVVLASGGFSLNKELLAKFVPAMTKAKAIVGKGSDGDGLKMAWAYGADIQDMPYIKATFGFSLDARGIADSFSLLMYKGGIMVNKAGKRFVDESKSYKLLGDEALLQPDAMAFQIYDEPIREEAKKDALANTTPMEKRGLIHSASTIAELAQKINIPAEVLETTVKEYNENVDKGADPNFGRKTLVAGYGKPRKIQQPPFYAFPSTAAILGTYGGIIVNGKAQVVDVFKNTIPNLYAAGEIMGGIHGAAYMTGTAFGKALIFGRIAAKNALGKA